MPSKRLFLRPDQLKPLINGNTTCVAFDPITVLGKNVDFMYREAPVNKNDSGWCFVSGNPSQEYVNNQENYGVYELNFVANCDPDIIPFLDAPCFSAFERDSSGKFVVYKDDYEIAYEKDRDKVIADITEAFRDVSREDGVTLNEAMAMDDYGDTAAARLKDAEKNWQEVSLTEHRNADWVFAYFDPKGFRYYLPAYMIWCLKNPRFSSNIGSRLIGCLTLADQSKINERTMQLDRFRILTSQQRKAVHDFLECLARHAPSSDVKIALQNYWAQAVQELP